MGQGMMTSTTGPARRETGQGRDGAATDAYPEVERRRPARGPLRPPGAIVPKQGIRRVAAVLQAMRADAVPAGERGPWQVTKEVITPGMSAAMLASPGRYPHPVAPGSYTHLFRHTMATIHLDRGECVMNDFPGELRKHLEFILRAEGRVLVTGLGLACVVRGLLAVGRAEEIVVVERERSVIDLVWPSLPADDRLDLVHADAIKFARKDRRVWDYAWHDLWTNTADGEEHLAVVHAGLMVALRFRARRQGAWAFPREYMRALGEQGIDGIGRDGR